MLQGLKKLYAGKRAPEFKPRQSFTKPTLVIQNSFCYTYNFSQELQDTIAQALTYKNEEVEGERIRTFMLLKMAKSRGQTKLIAKAKYRLQELDELEWVCWYKNDRFPTGHLNIVRDLLGDLPIDIRDERVIPQKRWLFPRLVELPPLRYYQSDMLQLAIEHSRGVFESAVGTGKSRILTEIIAHFGVNSLVVVPSSALAVQICNTLTELFGRKYISVLSTKLIKSGKKLAPIRITTVQGLAALQKAGLLQAAVGDVNLIAVDEIHHAGSKSYTNLLPEIEHIYYRFGFTGTFLRNDSKTLDMWGFLSNRLYFYPAYKAIEEGNLTPVEFRIHTVSGRRVNKYDREYKQNYCGEESELLPIIESILRDEAGANEQILILVDRKDEAGRIIHEYLDLNGIENVYISGDDKKDVVADAIKAFNSKRIRVLVGSTVLGEGVDLYSTDRLILARGGKSEIAIIQAIGRCVRLSPGKKLAVCHDFCFEGTKFLQRHLETRLDIYKNSFEGKVLWI